MIKRLLFFDEAYAFVFVVAVIERTIFTTFFTVIRHLKPGTCGSFKPIKSYFDGKRIDTYARAQNPFTGNVRLSILVSTICEKEEIEFSGELIIKNEKEKKETKQRQQVHIK